VHPDPRYAHVGRHHLAVTAWRETSAAWSCITRGAVDAYTRQPNALPTVSTLRITAIIPQGGGILVSTIGRM
jgi:hypothetical protein